jgi:antitoxin VapB
MSLNIKNPQVHAMARELADLRGCSMTEAIKLALEKALTEAKCQNQLSNGNQREQRLTEIALRCANLPDQDSRSGDDILGYDELGLPS